MDKPRSYGTLMQNIRADAYHSKRIRYSAYLKTEAAVSGAGLWMVLMAANQQNNKAWNMTQKPIQGTSDWKQYQWVLDVPEDAQILSFGIDLEGKGKVWVSDLQIEVVGSDVPLTPATE